MVKKSILHTPHKTYRTFTRFESLLGAICKYLTIVHSFAPLGWQIDGSWLIRHVVPSPVQNLLHVPGCRRGIKCMSCGLTFIPPQVSHTKI